MPLIVAALLALGEPIGTRSGFIRTASVCGLASLLARAPSPAWSAVRLPPFVQEQLGASADRPFDVGGGGRRNGGSGYLNQCPSRRSGRSCICTFEDPYSSDYVPPWTYEDAKDKSLGDAMQELVDVLKEEADARVVEAGDRYVLAEYRDPTLGTIDDVEFLFSTSTPALVHYRSASRTPRSVGLGTDDHHRKRIKALRLKLQAKGGWRSVGRLNM